VFSAEPYARRHNPWVNWQNDAPDAHPNQLPSTTNLRFDDFPTPAIFASLPTVSFVVPDNLHNMHDGARPESIERGDAWVRDNIDPYYQWAKTHNSLLIVTADEDDFVTNNHIPTVIVGPGVRAGATVPQTYTAHNLLRTIEDSYGTAHAGMANNVRPIAGAFVTDPALSVRTFQNGLDGYAGARDTQIQQGAPTTSYEGKATLSANTDVDAALAGDQASHALVKFDGVVGTGAGQIPSDATVVSAKLTLWTVNTFGATTTTPIRLHRMLSAWDDADTWDSFGGGATGVAADGVRAAPTPDFVYAPTLAGHPFFYDVSDSVQAWLDGATPQGWAVLPTGTDQYDFISSEGPEGKRPSLEVTFTLYPRFVTAAGGSWKAAENWAHGTPGGTGAVARFLANPSAATVTLDGDRTVGQLWLDSPNGYTLNPGTGGALSFANYGNTATVLAKQGRHTLAVPLKFTDPGKIDVAGGARVTATAGVSVAAGRTLTKAGAGLAEIAGGLALPAGARADVQSGVLYVDRLTERGGLDVRAGAVMRLTGTGSASVVGDVRLDGSTGAWTGTLDLGPSALVIDYDGASPLATVSEQVRFGRAGGGATPGIASSAAAVDPKAMLVVSEASTLLGLSAGQTGTFMGQTVDDTSLLLRLTRVADANFDDSVDFGDLVRVAQNYNTAVGAGAWGRGDFTDDGSVDFNDLVKLAQNYNTGIAPPAGAGLPGDFAADVAEAFAIAHAPEPVGMLWILGAGTMLGRRRR
jgi:hypothetical protein